eukprot:TRINITY_DN2682_c0_g1_i10.p1 TRINITY_DN2682_c0_g1~~TRINITY_DN2682_c0_g1_i10.p1  ORF type:complete len:180 (+),score=37.47 TRINITY_DN2682_c0_g1_i10:377-916(+)
MNSVRLVETSCVFLDHFVKTREESRRQLLESIKKRHRITERVDIKTSVAAIHRFGKPNMLRFEERPPPPKAAAGRLNTIESGTQRPVRSLMSHYNQLVDARQRTGSQIFKYTEMPETYSNYASTRMAKHEDARNEETTVDQMKSLCTARKPSRTKRISLIINRDKIKFFKSPRGKLDKK